MQQILFIAGATKRTNINQTEVIPNWWNIHFYFSAMALDSGRCWYRRVHSRSLISSFLEFFYQLAVRNQNEDAVIVCRTLGLDEGNETNKKKKRSNNSNGTNRRVNRICVFGTWCETRMFVVNIKTCRRHDVIGHIICIRALHECIECMRAVFGEGVSREEEEKLRENRNRMCLALAHTPTECVTFDDTMQSVECAGEILMRSEVCRTHTSHTHPIICYICPSDDGMQTILHVHWFCRRQSNEKWMWCPSSFVFRAENERRRIQNTKSVVGGQGIVGSRLITLAR